MKKIKLLSILIGLFFVPLAYAESVPTPRSADSRVTYVTYNPDDVTRINAKIGVATHIILNQDETYQTHAFGDSGAWHFANFNNSIFIKPKLENSSTNLVVITDRRTYNFYVAYTNQDTYEVRFFYPEQAKEKIKEKNIKSELESFANRFKGKKINLHYKMKGAKSVAPINVWDDGTFTYFKFGNNTELPAIYALNDNGEEILLNRTVMGNNDIVMLHGISKQWRIRIETEALDVFNEFVNQKGNAMENGTVTDKVIREVVNIDE